MRSGDCVSAAALRLAAPAMLLCITECLSDPFHDPPLCCSAFGIDLPPTVVFDYPTIDDLVGHLAARVRASAAPAPAPAAAADAMDSDSPSDSDSDSSSAGGQEAASNGAAAGAPEQRQLAVRRSSSDREQEQPNAQLVPAALPGPLLAVNKRAPRLTKPGYFTVRACCGWCVTSAVLLQTWLLLCATSLLLMKCCECTPWRRH